MAKSLLMMLVAPALASRDVRLQSMREQVLAFIQHGVPADALPFLNTIKGLLDNDIMGKIRDEQTSHTNEENNLYSAFGAADGEFNDEITRIAGAEAVSAETARTAYTGCRGEEGTAWSLDDTCDGQQADLQGTYNGHESAVNTKQQAEGVCDADAEIDWREDTNLGTVQTHVLNYKNAINTLIASRGLLEDKITECNGLQTALDQKKSTCDTAQTTFENAGCLAAVEVDHANDAYNTAYGNALSAFTAQTGIWNEQSGDRVAQCKLVTQLSCYISALHDNDDQGPLGTAVGDCDTAANAADHACEGMAFTHRDAPSPLANADIPAYPCGAGWSYGDHPQGTAVREPHGCCDHVFD